MRPLSGLPGRRDPAPSRMAYRLQRFLLTPRYRAALRIGLPLVGVVALVAVWASDPGRRQAVVDGVAEIRQSIENRPEFALNLMRIDGASPAVAEAIRLVAPIEFPVTSFDVDLDALQARVAALDPVARATVRIRAGGILQIDVEERVPAALWRTAEGLTVLDAGGRRIAAAGSRTDRPELPLLAGEGAARVVPEALALVAAANPIAPRVRGFVRVGERRWDVVLDREQRILLPENRPVQALEMLLALDKGQELLDRDVVVVDLRNSRRPTLRLSPFAMGELNRIRSLSAGGLNQ